MKKIISVLIFSFLCMVCAAEVSQPVKWRMTIKMTSVDKGTATIKASIQPGWHLYGTDIAEGGPVATSFDLSASRGVNFTGPVKARKAPVEIYDEMFEMNLSWWDSSVSFTVPFTVTSPDSATITAKIKCMVCDGTSCRPPKIYEVSSTIPEFIPSEK